jgi:hypothetical protein
VIHSADLTMLDIMNAVFVHIISAAARTVQMLARCAANPSRAANGKAMISAIVDEFIVRGSCFWGKHEPADANPAVVFSHSGAQIAQV